MRPRRCPLSPGERARVRAVIIVVMQWLAALADELLPTYEPRLTPLNSCIIVHTNQAV